MSIMAEKQLDVVMDWVSTRLDQNDIPRVTDIVDYAHSVLGYRDLTQRQIGKRLRLHPAYLFNSTQQRQKRRSQKYRPIIINTLGSLHADIGYFPVTREYETPKSFRAGFLVAKDVLSRYTYIIVLKKSKKAESMMAAFTELMKQHEKVNDGLPVRSISFDRETSVVGNQVQQFLLDHRIAFHAFKFSRSKAKMAEGAIKLVRVAMARLQRENRRKGKEVRWWHLIHHVTQSLNSQIIRIDGKSTGYAPKDVNAETLDDFIRRVHKAAPAYFFSQFDIAPQLVNFKFDVGQFVRPKLIVTSSEVIGNKTSETNLESDPFEIVRRLPYVTRGLTVGKLYVCKSLVDQSIESFYEDDVALTDPSVLSGPSS
jgi:hypothetical protein